MYLATVKHANVLDFVDTNSIGEQKIIKIMHKLSLLLAVITIAVLVDTCIGALEGKLECTKKGIYPDEKLIGVIMQKCQPKLDDGRDLLVACVTKCLMKQLKALTKKGKMKQTESSKMVDLLPDKYQEPAKVKFDECFKEHESNIKKESKCDSWIPFSKCFIGFATSDKLI